MSGKHFTEKPWVVYMKYSPGGSYASREVQEIARDLTYEKAIYMYEQLTKRYTDYEEYNTLRLLYNYTLQEDFDKCQSIYKSNSQLNLFE